MSNQTFLIKIWGKIKEWYKGKYIPPKLTQYSSITVLDTGGYKRPFIAKYLIVLKKFWIRHWQWIIGTILAVLALIRMT